MIKHEHYQYILFTQTNSLKHYIVLSKLKTDLH
jgi:hypothetical protein